MEQYKAQHILREHRVRTEIFHHLDRVDDVAERLGHLLPARHDEAVDNDALGVRELCGHEHCLPHCRLLTVVVLAAVLHDRPPFLEFIHAVRPPDRGDVVHQGVKPYIHDVFLVARDRNSPRHLARQTRDREIFESARDERFHFIEPRLRGHKAGMRFVEVGQLLCVVGKAKEIILLFAYLKLAVGVDRAATVFIKLRLGLLELTSDTILHSVEFLIDVAVCGTTFPKLLRRHDVMLVCRADKVVDGKIEERIQSTETRSKAVRIGLRGDPLLGRRFMDLCAVFVGARIQKDFFSLGAVISREGVSANELHRVSDVCIGVHIRKRGGDIDMVLLGHREIV